MHKDKLKAISVMLFKDLDEDVLKWLEYQNNQTASLKQLIRVAIKEYGFREFTNVLIDEKKE